MAALVSTQRPNSSDSPIATGLFPKTVRNRRSEICNACSAAAWAVTSRSSSCSDGCPNWLSGAALISTVSSEPRRVCSFERCESTGRPCRSTLSNSPAAAARSAAATKSSAGRPASVSGPSASYRVSGLGVGVDETGIGPDDGNRDR